MRVHRCFRPWPIIGNLPLSVHPSSHPPRRPMSHDTWIHRVARACVAAPLAGTPVTPNHLTALRLVLGLASAAAFAGGERGLVLAGCAAFLVSMLLDRADGELARLTGRTSRLGHVFDVAADAVCDCLVLVAVGIGARHGMFGEWAIAMGALAGVSAAAILLALLHVEARRGAGTVRFSGPAGFDPDDAMILIPIALAADLADWLLLASALTAPAVALVLVPRLLKAARAAPRT